MDSRLIAAGLLMLAATTAAAEEVTLTSSLVSYAPNTTARVSVVNVGPTYRPPCTIDASVLNAAGTVIGAGRFVVAPGSAGHFDVALPAPVGAAAGTARGRIHFDKSAACVGKYLQASLDGFDTTTGAITIGATPIAKLSRAQ